MTDTIEQAERLRALYEAATPGPWYFRTLENFGFNVVHYNDGDKFDIKRVAKAGEAANAALIVAMHEALPDLIAQAERAKLLEVENDRLRGDLVKYADSEIMGYCESCLAPVFPEDETVTDPDGDCIGCWYGMTDVRSKRDRPCYAYRVGKPDARHALSQTGTRHAG